MVALRVFYVIDSLVGGGAERSLAGVAPLLIGAGIDLHVVPLLDRPGVEAALESAGATVHPAVGAVRAHAVGPLTGMIRRVRPDLVHTTLFEADVAGRIAARRAHAPVVTSLVGPTYSHYAMYPMRRRHRLLGAQLCDLATARLARRFHAVSAAVADSTARSLALPRRRIDVVWRGRDADQLGRRTPERRAAVRASLGVDAAPLVVAVGRHEPQKGFDVLVSGWPAVIDRFPSARLLIAGREGRSTAALHDLTTALELDATVTMLGPREDVADLLSAADVFALSSRFEGLPGVLIEALALEAPVVATDLREVVEVLGDRSIARLVPADDAASLAGGIADALEASQARPCATAAGRQRFLEAFTLERAAAGMVAFYTRSLA
jgi:glycosyltransferase involved in cell wall biosynthesis